MFIHSNDSVRRKAEELFNDGLALAKSRYLDDNKNINVHHYVSSRINTPLYRSYKQTIAMNRAEQYSKDMMSLAIFLIWFFLSVAAAIALNDTKYDLNQSPYINIWGISMFLIVGGLAVDKFIRYGKAEARENELLEKLHATKEYLELEMVEEYMPYLQDTNVYNSVKKIGSFVDEQLAYRQKDLS